MMSTTDIIPRLLSLPHGTIIVSGGRTCFITVAEINTLDIATNRNLSVSSYNENFFLRHDVIRTQVSVIKSVNFQIKKDESPRLSEVWPSCK